jgi:hypothetical protein
MSPARYNSDFAIKKPHNPCSPNNPMRYHRLETAVNHAL